jgi:D-arabinose 1-dehydrogenase-like Zn-dependent alcohol dehydrogenase
VIPASVPNSKAMPGLIARLSPNGELMVMGVTCDPMEAARLQLVRGIRTIQARAAGTPDDFEDTLRFAQFTCVRPMTETYPLLRASQAYERMMSGKAQFGVVLTM